MRIIDADKLKRRTVCVMEPLSEEEVSVVYSEDIDKAPTIVELHTVNGVCPFCKGLITIDLQELKWYYPAKGEYPKYGEWVLVIAKEDAAVLPPGKWVMQYFDKSENVLRSDKYFANATNSIYASNVKCWQYIVPPKEKE